MTIFCKHNSSRYADSLLKEAQGLQLLSDTLQQTQNTLLSVPRVHSVNEIELQIDQIDNQAASHNQMAQLGAGLAQLHAVKQAYYGYENDNYIGLNPQKNRCMEDWGEFFFEDRLSYQVSLIQSAAIQHEFSTALADKQAVLINFLNQHCDFPSLLHGDLWSGNVLFDKKQVWLIDPAVYYGDREVDIAMTEMFGGFSRDFYSAYEDSLPLSSQYPLKKIIYNLYHYLNHYNLFGGGYLSACETGFSKIKNL